MYINSKKFSDELKKSFEQDRLTDKFVEMLLILVKKLSQHNKHLSTADVEDIQMCAIEVVLKNWKQFDFNKNDNVFAWFSSVVFNGLKAGYKQLHPYVADKKIEFVRFNSYDIIETI